MPENKNTVIGNIETVENGNDFGIKANDSPFAVSFYFDDYYNDKSVKTFIKNVEKLIRTSKEYKMYIELLRTNIFALNHDSIMTNITTADVDLEFHHNPFTLYDLVEITMLHHIANNEKFTSFSLAKEIMNLHYSHKIGLTPLTRTTHELVHSANLFISARQIFGDYHSFMEEYSDGISANLLQKVNTMEQMTEDGVPSDFKGIFK